MGFLGAQQPARIPFPNLLDMLLHSMEERIVINRRPSADHFASEKALQVASHLAGALVTLGRGLLQRLQTNPLQAICHSRVQPCGRGRVFIKVCLDDLVDRFADKWLAASQHLEEQHAQRINICLRPTLAALNHFRREVSRCAHQARGRRFRFRRCAREHRDAEVHDGRRIILPHEDVAGLKVAMDDAGNVRLVESRADVGKDTRNPFRARPGQGGIRRLAFDQFHHEERRLVVQTLLDQPRCARQVELPGAFDFLREPFARQRVLAQRRVENFDRHDPAIRLMLRLVNDAKRAFSQPRYGAVARQFQAGHERCLRLVGARQPGRLGLAEAQIRHFAQTGRAHALKVVFAVMPDGLVLAGEVYKVSGGIHNNFAGQDLARGGGFHDAMRTVGVAADDLHPFPFPDQHLPHVQPNPHLGPRIFHLADSE